MSQLIQDRLFRRRSFQPISWLSTEKRKLTQQKQTCIHKQNILQHKINTKNYSQVWLPTISVLESEWVYSGKSR